MSPDSIAGALKNLTGNNVVVMNSCITRLKENTFASMWANIRMAENLGRFLETTPVGQVIFLSTVDIYGLLPGGVRISEELLPNPNDYYAISKLTSEYLLKRALSKSGIPLTIFRLTGVYGPGDEGKSTIYALVQSARTRGKITIFGDGSNQRDFIYVDDLSKVIMEAIRQKSQETVNIAVGKSLAIKDIAALIAAGFKGRCTLEFKPSPSPSEERIKDMVYDVRRLNSVFPNISFTDLEKGISLYLSLLYRI